MCSDVRAPTWPPSPQTFEAARRSGGGPRGWASRRLEMHTGAYPERRDRRPGVLDRWAWRAVGPAVRWGRARQVRPSALIRDVAAAEIGLAEGVEVAGDVAALGLECLTQLGERHRLSLGRDRSVAGLDLAKLRDAALGLSCGGVGYYPTSDFIHVDVGRVRRWSGD